MKSSKSRLVQFLIVLAIIIAFIVDIVLFIQIGNGTTAKRGQENPADTPKAYKEISYPTPNYDKNRTNDVMGVVLHHTAEPTVEKSLEILSSPAKKVGTHVVIDTDGTRYIMAGPTVATYHAGLSILNGRESCNYCTIGIEFQGNTLEQPLTDDQIASGIAYLLPIIAEYRIPLKNIVTHEMVRTAYMQKYPQKRCSVKVDITQTEYLRFMTALRYALKGKSINPIK